MELAMFAAQPFERWQEIRRPILALVMSGTMITGTAPMARAQTPGSFSIHVESNQVLVPTYVFYKDRIKEGLSQDLKCLYANEATFSKLRPDQAFIPPDCHDTIIRGLVAKDFRLLEDGVEREIQRVTLEPEHVVNARDNLDDHFEWSETPVGKWSTVETPRAFIRSPTLSLYRIAYVPARSAEGSCHRVEVKVDRPTHSFTLAASTVTLSTPPRIRFTERFLANSWKAICPQVNKQRSPCLAKRASFTQARI